MKLLRSKQSEDVASLSIVHNTNASTIENQYAELLKKNVELEDQLQEMSTKLGNQSILLGVDLSKDVEAQVIGKFLVVVSKSTVGTNSSFQLYISYDGANGIYDFSKSIYQCTKNEFVKPLNSIKHNQNSAILNLTLQNSELSPSTILNVILIS